MMEPWMFSCIHIGIRDTVVACFTVIDNLFPGCGWSSSTLDRLEDIHAYIGWIVWEKLIHPSSVHGCDRRRICMKDGLTVSKEREFEDVFGAIMKEFADRDYNNREVVNALACSLCVVAMRSNDPEVFIDDICEKMVEFIRSSVRASDLYSRPAPE